MKTRTKEETRAEAIGWMSFIFFLVLFPVLFFACVWLPKWLGLWDNWTYFN